jgi:hypothetical protein
LSSGMSAGREEGVRRQDCLRLLGGRGAALLGQPCCPRLNGLLERYFSLDYTGFACDSIELITRLLSVNLTRTAGSLRLQVVI